MIPERENQYVEFKQEAVTASELAEEVVAFANAEGGEIWLGVDDQGRAVGLSRSYEEDVINICRSGCIPPIHPANERQNACPYGIELDRPVRAPGLQDNVIAVGRVP